MRKLHNKVFNFLFNIELTEKTSFIPKHERIINLKPLHLKESKFSRDLYHFQEPLNSLDLCNSKLEMKHGFLYDYLVSEETLVDSLSKLLTIYPQLGGRFKIHEKTKEVVNDFSNSNLELMVIKSDKELPKQDLVEWKPFMYKVPVRAPLSLNTPLFRISLTHFEKENKSLIAIHHTHGLMDGKGFSNILNQWTKITKGEFPQDLKTFYLGESLILKEPKNLPYNEKNGHILLSKVLFDFPKLTSNLTNLVLKVEKNFIEDVKKKSPSMISTNDIITSLILKSYSNLKKEDTSFTLYNTICGRKFYNIPLEFIGNCLSVHDFNISLDELKSESIENLALKYRKNLSLFQKDKFIEQHHYLSNVQKQDPTLNEFINIPMYRDIPSRIFFTTNLTMMNPFHLNFGQGGPVEFNKPFYDVQKFVQICKSKPDELMIKIPITRAESKIFEKNFQKLLN